MEANEAMVLIRELASASINMANTIGTHGYTKSAMAREDPLFVALVGRKPTADEIKRTLD